MREFDAYDIDRPPFEEDLKVATKEELADYLLKQNKALCSYGVDLPVREIIFRGSKHGSLYEDRRISPGSHATRITPMNCFMALISAQPVLKKLPNVRFEELGGIISRIAMAADKLRELHGKNKIPLTEELWQSPMNQLQQKNP